MEPTWVQSAPAGPHVGPLNLAIRDAYAPLDPDESRWQFLMAAGYVKRRRPYVQINEL